jgi:hypothetical protein
MKKCLFCSKDFQIKYKSWNKKKFCSQKCYWDSLKGRKLLENTKQKISIANQGHQDYKGMLGKHHSDETKKKIGLANTKLNNKIIKICRICNKSYELKNKPKINSVCKSCSRKLLHQRWLLDGTEKIRRQKISKYNKTNGKVPPSWLGKKLTISHRKKLKESHSGKKSIHWKGGVTPINKIIRHSLEYTLWRESIFARDNWTCQKTKIKGGKLVAHHIKNFANYPELRFAIDNGITFSEKVHLEFHKKYGIKNNTEEQLNEFLKK